MPIIWNLSVSKFVARVLQKCNVIGASETASAADYSLARDVIDGALKAMHADGLLWWAIKTEPLAFTGASLARPADCVECLFAYWFDGGDRKVRVIERTEYEAIPHKADTGAPDVVFDDNGTLYLHPVPSSGVLRLTYQREILDTEDGAPLDVPKKLLHPLIDYLAHETAPYFGITGKDAQRLAMDYERARVQLARLNAQSAEPGVVATDYF